MYVLAFFSPLQFSLTLITCLTKACLVCSVKIDKLALFLFWVFINLDFDCIHKNTQKKSKANISLSSPNKFGHQFHVWCPLKVIAGMADNYQIKRKQESPKGDFDWAARGPFWLRGGGGSTHSLYPFGRLSYQEKWVPFLNHGCVVAKINSTIVNKNKPVSHSKHKMISIIFKHPSPNPWGRGLSYLV